MILFFLSQGYFRSPALARCPATPGHASPTQREPPSAPSTLPAAHPSLRARHQNCLREIRSSLEQSKPLVIVQEADPAKGGGTLQALRDECPDELQSDIFDQGRTQTTWYRIEEFQRVSLKTIVEAPLVHTPRLSL